MLGANAGSGGSIADLCAAITSRKNKEHALRFSQAEYRERMVFVPQCLRSTSSCAAQERAAEYICARCHSCKIGAIVERAESLGYREVRILKGGSAIPAILKECRPAAILGVACNLEGALGTLECERFGTAIQFVSLARDGCADTDVDLDEVMETMEFRQP